MESSITCRTFVPNSGLTKWPLGACASTVEEEVRVSVSSASTSRAVPGRADVAVVTATAAAIEGVDFDVSTCAAGHTVLRSKIAWADVGDDTSPCASYSLFGSHSEVRGRDPAVISSFQGKP